MRGEAGRLPPVAHARTVRNLLDDAGGLCCVDGSHAGGDGSPMKPMRRSRPPMPMPSGLAGFRFPP